MRLEDEYGRTFSGKALVSAAAHQPRLGSMLDWLCDEYFGKHLLGDERTVATNTELNNEHAQSGGG